MNAVWIKEHLNTFFAGKPSIEDINSLISSKINMFNGKLYKYCSFGKNDSNHSLSNLRDGIIYFSKPADFNDPFDCALGFSIDEAIISMLPSMIDKNLKIDSENEGLVKELMKNLFFEKTKPFDCDNSTLQMISILVSSPQLIDLIKSISNGEKVDDNLLQEKLFQMLSDPTIASKFFGVISNPKSPIDRQAVSKSDVYKTIMQALFKNPALIELAGEQAIPSEAIDVTNAISAILSEDSVIGKIEKLANITEYKDKDIHKEIEKLHSTLDPIMPKLKGIVNEQFAISCFSTSPDNILMWSHYADKHRGFCIEYDFTKLKDKNILLLLYPVIYSERRPTVPMTLFDLDNLKEIKLSNNREVIPDIIMALLTKSKIWDYENEWRIIAMKSDLDEQKLNEDIAVKVYYGANISDNDKELLNEVIKEKNLEAQQYVLDFDKFKLNIK